MELIINYLKVSFRDLKRNKISTGINLIGLVSGLTVSLFMVQYVLFETSFDKFHEDYDQIYRVVNDRYQNGELVQHSTITFPAVGPALAADFPEVESFTRMTYNPRSYISYNDELFLADQFLVVDERFPTFFDFEMVAGKKETCLDAAFKSVLTRSFAKKLISKEEDVTDLIGKSLGIYGGHPFKITGIMEDPPANSHLQFEVLISYKTFIQLAGEGADTSWSWSDFYHYVKLAKGADPTSVAAKLPAFSKRYFSTEEELGGKEEFSLQPLSEAHLNDTMEYEVAIVTNGKVVWLMLAIAIFIVIIAWINYINLNVSRAIQRAKEVGIRKSIGARKAQIVRQFFIETLLINVIALVISLVLVTIFQPLFNTLTGLDLDLANLWWAKVWSLPFPLVFVTVLLVSISLVASYPASLITRFSTQDVLKGSFKLKGEISWLRKGMVVFQFCSAVVLVTAAIAISRQIDFMVNQDLGIDVENTMVVYGPSKSQWDSTFIQTIDRFKEDLKGLSGVELATVSSRVVGSRMSRAFNVRSSANPEAQNLTANIIHADHEFSELYGIQLIAGRDLAREDHHFDGSLVRNMIINESAVSLLKFNSAKEAIGKTAKFYNKDWTIIGVIKDFHQLTLHEKIEPIFFLPYYSTNHSISIKLTGEPSEAMIAAIQGSYDDHFPGNYFDYFYLEDQFASLYQDDVRLEKISTAFTFLSILIAIMGLYGQVMLNLQKKTKEIGVRKVLGADLPQLFRQLSREFMVLVFLAIAIGAPLSYFVIQKWKSNFAYTADIGIEIIVGASFILIIISILTIALQTKKIAQNNPVDSLKCE